MSAKEPDEPDRVLVVVWQPIRCPRCNERHRIRNYRTQGKLRYHKCLSCEAKFKSLEQRSIPA